MCVSCYVTSTPLIVFMEIRMQENVIFGDANVWYWRTIMLINIWYLS